LATLLQRAGEGYQSVHTCNMGTDVSEKKVWKDECSSRPPRIERMHICTDPASAKDSSVNTISEVSGFEHSKSMA
jgi:hypothetical protein